MIISVVGLFQVLSSVSGHIEDDTAAVASAERTASLDCMMEGVHVGGRGSSA